MHDGLTTAEMTKPYNCPKCSHAIGRRCGDTLFYAGLELRPKKSLNLICPECAESIFFYVANRRPKPNDRQ